MPNSNVSEVQGWEWDYRYKLGSCQCVDGISLKPWGGMRLLERKQREH